MIQINLKTLKKQFISFQFWKYFYCINKIWSKPSKIHSIWYWNIIWTLWMNAYFICSRIKKSENVCYAFVHDSLLLDAPLTTRRVVWMCRIRNKRTNFMQYSPFKYTISLAQKQKSTISKRFCLHFAFSVDLFAHSLTHRHCYCCLLLWLYNVTQANVHEQRLRYTLDISTMPNWKSHIHILRIEQLCHVMCAWCNCHCIGEKRNGWE